jgi:hypothetical protein
MQLRPNAGDVMICDVEPALANSRTYWVRSHARGSDTQLFEGPDAWARAYAAAQHRAGSEGIIWKRHNDGHYEKLR